MNPEDIKRIVDHIERIDRESRMIKQQVWRRGYRVITIERDTLHLVNKQGFDVVTENMDVAATVANAYISQMIASES